MAKEPQQKTSLHAWHAPHGARFVEFGGWSMPVQYTTIVEEHQAVRNHVGLFDISHMGRLTLDGPDVVPCLELLTTNRVAALEPNQIQYSLMTNEQGGVIDDILVYRLPHSHLVVCNASNRLRVVEQLRKQAQSPGATLNDRTLDTAMIAIQGPQAEATLQPLCGVPLTTLKYYHAALGRLLDSIDTAVSRTGYTGEDGFEVIVPAAQAERVWTALLESGASHGIRPCGLGARDTLRFEAAMPLYGHELLETINPFEAGVGWAVKLDKGEFLGREALVKARKSPGKTRVGLQLDGKRIARQGSAIFGEGRTVGEVTSGTFAPTLQRSLAMALVEPGAAAVGSMVEVDVRGHREPAQVVKLPFYRRPVAKSKLTPST
jgi:aminomethyltransferase